MSTWTADQLDRLGAANEIDIAPQRDDGTFRGYTTIWIVRVDHDLYVRSFNGPDGSWYQTARHSGAGRVRTGGTEHDVTLEPAAVDVDAVDAAYRSKYGRSPYVDAMVTDDSAATTLRLLPRSHQ
jgi:hypothetical protein